MKESATRKTTTASRASREVVALRQPLRRGTFRATLDAFPGDKSAARTSGPSALPEAKGLTRWH